MFQRFRFKIKFAGDPVRKNNGEVQNLEIHVSERKSSEIITPAHAHMATHTHAQIKDRHADQLSRHADQLSLL